ncbi:MAG: hypothetical protein P4L56_00110 [Candidatus Sulfopaludibacter sp.]|nr:hypothetical protein [Candidatus Sulfopaludibacter sp.]
MLAAVGGEDWERPYPAAASCANRVPIQIEIYATVQWTQHCSQTSGGLIHESFYYVFGEPARTAELRVDLRPVDESPQFTADLLAALRSRLTARLGAPGHAPEMMEIGFRHLRFGQPVNGDHWKDGPLDYFLHANQSSHSPMGMRKGVELIVLHDRLMREWAKDGVITQLEGMGVMPLPDDAVPEAPVHNPELLWRTWRDSPNTRAGEAAFVALENRGWNTDTREGCPANPDLFREVIQRGEAFLASHPQTAFRKQVLYALAVANESWWSIARAPADDPIVSAPPYPRREINARQAGAARSLAIQYYRQVVQLAPDSPEALSALRRLPRLELGFDTGQRRFFCSYC